MRNTELQKDIPHIIAIAVLLLALLIVATKTGLVSCSALGNGYCDVYYSMLGKPTVLIIRGDEGMGSPDTLARMIQDYYRLPVEKLRIGQVSRGNIQHYSLVIVEHARRIPTEKLKIFKDYLFEDMGRLVWVGDAGTIGAPSDESCRLMEYSAEWSAKDGKHRQSYEDNICIKESEVSIPADATASEALSLKRDALVKKAVQHLSGLCEDAFGGQLGTYGPKGYPCNGASYNGVYFNWKNEQQFRSSLSPWTRGEYEKLTTEGKQPGIDFGKDVLGVGFVADDFAVAEFDSYHSRIDEIKDDLVKAHAGFVACSKNISSGKCNAGEGASLIDNDLVALQSQKDSAKSELNGIVATLSSLAQQKDAKNESSYYITTAATAIQGDVTDISAVAVPQSTVTPAEIALIGRITSSLKSAKETLTQLRGDEADPAVRANYDRQISTVGSRITSFEAKLAQLSSDLASYNKCSSQGDTGGVIGKIAAETGHRNELAALASYASPLLDENGALDFIHNAQGSNWKELAHSLKSIQLNCGKGFKEGMKEAADAILAAQGAATAPANESKALATMQVADTQHPLVEGITKSKDLKKGGLPVPFVLVETNDIDSHQVVQLHVTPAYKGINTWPGIAIKDPKFASHMFGRGVVVYYAFPPETDEVFVKGLVKFLLY